MFLKFLFLFVCGGVGAVPKLIIISYSGFSNNYFNRNVTPFMNHLKDKYVDVEYMTSIIGGNAHTHHFTFEEDSIQEVAGTAKEDGIHNPRYSNQTISVYTYHGDIMPIWIINELSGENRSSGLMMWPGGEFSFNGTRATHVRVYDNATNWESRIDQIISWFNDDEHPINLAMLYFEEPRKPTPIDNFLKEIDSATHYLYHQLKLNNLTDVNVIHVSDLTRMNLASAKLINITEIIGTARYDIVGSPSARFIKPHTDDRDAIYTKLKVISEATSGFDVYWSDDLPDIIQIRQNLQVNDIVVVAEDGYVFEDVVKTFAVSEAIYDVNANAQDEGVLGEFQDAERPKAFFFATGPAFQENCTLKPFNSVDLFPLFCHVLDITCHEEGGSIDAFEECLTDIEDKSSEDLLIAGLLLLLLFLIIIAITVFFVLRKRRQQKLPIEEYSKSQMDSTLPRS